MLSADGRFRDTVIVLHVSGSASPMKIFSVASFSVCGSVTLLSDGLIGVLPKEELIAMPNENLIDTSKEEPIEMSSDTVRHLHVQ